MALYYYPLVSEDLKERIHKWVRNYDNAINSPRSDDTNLVTDEETGKKTKSC